MDDQLLDAILAMDSYNRGYNQGIDGLSDAVGTQLGTITITKTSSVFGVDVDQSKGFYAVAYTVPASNVVIAYRGTDELTGTSFFGFRHGIGSDIWNGYGVGAGSSKGDQAGLAFDFYRQVIGTSNNP